MSLKLYLWTVKIKFHINVMGHEILFFRYFSLSFKNAEGLFFAHSPYKSGNGLDFALGRVIVYRPLL